MMTLPLAEGRGTESSLCPAGVQAEIGASTSQFCTSYPSPLWSDRTAALREAQVDLVRRPLRVPGGKGGAAKRSAAAPYFWAALQHVGPTFLRAR